VQACYHYLTFVRHEAAESEVPSSTAATVDSGRQPPQMIEPSRIEGSFYI